MTDRAAFHTSDTDGADRVALARSQSLTAAADSAWLQKRSWLQTTKLASAAFSKLRCSKPVHDNSVGSSRPGDHAPSAT